MLNGGTLVLIGGGIGAAVRESLMLGVGNLPGGFPMPIFIANMTAALLIGVLSALTITGGVIDSGGKLLLTTGIMGGLSTFSSLVWGTHQMLANPVEQAGIRLSGAKHGRRFSACGVWSLAWWPSHALSHLDGRRGGVPSPVEKRRASFRPRYCSTSPNRALPSPMMHRARARRAT